MNAGVAELGQMRRTEGAMLQNSCSFRACESSNLSPRIDFYSDVNKNSK